MNICGVLVHANPSKASAVADAMAKLPGVEVHSHAQGGRIVITVEDTAETTAFDMMTEINRLDGIVAASLVYHHFGADETAAQSV